jgi:DNA-directed RNA polymerase specialized sigma24 family protein
MRRSARSKNWCRCRYRFCVSRSPVYAARPCGTASPPAALAERQQSLDRLSAALSRLGDRCRELFRLKLEGHNFGEIRKRMGAGSINTIYTWDSRCRQLLLEQMGEGEAAP